ncbi:hypothetical protein B0T22DRAFT_139941 [Podospora appendiculata]|uniref:Uncharacterized protein n=1 Tax=Podospora appendiculata TaxID=314037 RepID=A0AAE0X8M3_9PEZI|nr:hypothetical protein B0T22DRAFT_139941 [Podospora appendiculata]
MTGPVHGGTAPLAALTTVFTPPCPTTWLITSTKILSQYPDFPTTGSPSCDPPSWAENLDSEGFQYYSPAICPKGFAVGPSCLLSTTRTAQGFPAIEPGETAAWCVPSGFTCTTDLSDFRGGVWGFTHQGTKNAAFAATVGPAMQIRWVDADLSMLETHPLIPGRTPAKVKTVVTSTAPVAMQTFTVMSPATPMASPELDTATPSTSTESATSSAAQSSPGPDANPAESSTTVDLSIIAETTQTIGLSPTGTSTSTTDADPSGTSGPIQSIEGGGGSGFISRGTGIILIVLLSVLIAIAVWIVSFVLVRRYKAGKLNGFPPLALVRFGIRRGRVYRRYRDSEGSTPILARHRVVGAELGGREVLSELDSAVLRGTTPNPAELEGRGVGDPSVRWSWVSHVSRFLTGHGRSSAPSTARESFGEKVNDPAVVLARPGALHTRPSSRPATTESSRVSSSIREASRRVSRDTFGFPRAAR